MEPEELPDALYDFLYRDSGRITSYYAQFFGGHLTGLEQQDSEKHIHNKQTKLDAGFISHQETTAPENQKTDKRIIDPHDLIATDVLSHFSEQNFLHTDIEAAPHGALVASVGTLVFADKSMLEVASVVYDALIKEEQQKPKSTQSRAKINELNLIKAIMEKIQLPSAFLLKTSTGLQVVGIIKNEGMEEAIPSYYFKHGSAGLSNVYVIGIKETPSKSYTLSATDFLNGIQQAAQGLSEMLFPADAVRVTPIALFRRIENTQQLLPLES